MTETTYYHKIPFLGRDYIAVYSDGYNSVVGYRRMYAGKIIYDIMLDKYLFKPSIYLVGFSYRLANEISAMMEKLREDKELQ